MAREMAGGAGAPETAVLVMAYGTPTGLGDVERYLRDIRRGVPTPPDLLEELTGRYRAIGGRSPLFEITEAQRRGIERRLEGVPTYLGQKHAAPTIPDALAAMAGDAIRRAVGIVLAPHFSTMSIGDYTRRAEQAARDAGWGGQLDVVQSWHLEPGFIEWLAERVHEAIRALPEQVRDTAVVIFTAHSLPARILDRGDPYPEQLEETAAAVAETAGLQRVVTGWQSAGRTPEAWIGPDVLDVVRDLAAAGVGGVVVCACGFVADHLEVLYDIDIECKGLAEKLGIPFSRTRSPNDDPDFLDTLTGVVARALGRGE
jgi:protoporphyrin/coproporphyrin ferrochelatase